MTSYDFRVQAQPVGFFETPVAFGQLTGGEPLLTDLEAVIRQRKTGDEGVRRSNVGSWHSDTRMLEWGGPAATQLANTAVNMAKRMSHFKESSPDRFNWLVQMWANVTPQGGMNDVHVHPGNLWAAVLYIDMGDGGDGQHDVGGHFFFEDPRFPMIAMRNTGMRMLGIDGQPQELQPELKLQRGSLLVFPAWLRHGVRTYTGNRERITVAINIDAVPK